MEVNEAFAKKALPSPIHPFTRGQNGERRYHAPKTVLLPASALKAAPVSFAQTPQDDRVYLLPSEWDLHTKTARRMVLDVAALESVVAGETAQLLAPLPDGSALRLVIHSVKSRAGMTHTLQGEVAGEPQSSVVQLVLHDGIVHGTISRYSRDQHLEYRILASGYMMVRELDNASLNALCGDPGIETGSEENPNDPPAPATPDQEGPAEDTPGYVTIDVVVGYDKGAREADGGVSQMEARIIASVDRMTTAFANSLVTGTELMLLGTIEDPHYVFPGRTAGTMSGTDELGDLNNTSPTNPQLNTVSDYANALGADLKAFIVRQADGSAGVAYRPGTSSITARDYMTSNRITFSHELAHNIGARHSWGDTSGTDADVNVHSYGWRLAPQGQPRVRTIMAYDWAWGSGTRIPYFSNPHVSFQGARTGQVNGYNAAGDPLSDPRYVSGGLVGGLGAGFNGTRLNLGARNAHFIHAEAPGRASLQVRNAFELLTPTTAATFAPGESIDITWAGGDHSGTVSIDLYKAGVLQSSIAQGLSALTRNHSWSIPSAMVSGSDYFLRLTLTGGLTADSGLFNIFGSGMAISPFNDLIATGDPGGPFAPEAITYQLINPGHPTFSWSASVNAPWVSLSQNEGTLAADESTPLIVAINETAANLPAGVHHATLTITDFGTGHEHQKIITIQAIGRPQIRLEHPMGTPLDQNAPTLDFGEVFRSAKASRRLTIQNTGAVDLLLGNPQLSGPQAAAFSLLPFSSTSIPPGSSASLSVVFSPTAQIAHEATLRIFSNDSLASSIQIQLTGMGDQLSNNVQLVADIHSSPRRLSPNSTLSMGSYALITVFTPEHGNELWRTDGTDAGTYLLADINVGTASSDVTQLTRVGELAYFAATSSPTGAELWVTDGTPSGTRMIRDINLGVGSSNPRSFCKLGSSVYFAASTTATGAELWKTDGTAAGTTLVVDLLPGLQSSGPNFLTEFKGELYFAANASSLGAELYKSDGTAAGTVLISDIQPGINGSQPNLFTVVGDTLFFTATTSLGRELWKTDGTALGTVLVRDLVTGAASGNPTDLVALNNTLYFRAATVSSGTQLWRSDGTTDGTVRVTTLNLGNQFSLSGSLVVFNGRLYFSGASAVHSAKLWSSDGTSDGTVPVHDIGPTNLSYSPSQFSIANGLLFFSASSPLGTELWRTDGTTVGTTLTRDIHLGSNSSSPGFLTSVGSLLVFTTNDGQGNTLWRSDGSLGGTVPVADSVFGSASSNPTNIANLKWCSDLCRYHGTIRNRTVDQRRLSPLDPSAQ
jgi:ELWxxDGT repeat protein